MYGKIEIFGKIVVKTGMHIGGNNAFSSIGAVDSVVIKDPLTDRPIIPGSSLKGKMRTLLAKQYNEKIVQPNNDDKKILGLFGSSPEDGGKKGSSRVSVGRLIFSDSIMTNWEDLKKQGLKSKTEVKFENSISRTTAVANPRQIERVVRGSEFGLSLIYEAYDKNFPEGADLVECIVEDIKLILEGMRLLEYDYIGGSGTRGYGKIRFEELDIATVVGNCDILDEVEESCRKLIEGR